MGVGTADPLYDDAVRDRRPGGGAAGGNGGGKRGGSGDDGDWKDAIAALDEPPPDKAKVVTWFLLLVVLMTFGGLIGAYIVIATNNVLEWRPFELPIAVWVSTALIIISSFTYHYGKIAVDQGKTCLARKYFVATSVLGGLFIASQLIAWMSLVQRGVYVYGHPYAGFFYVLTAVHAVHVLGGIVALGAILLRSWNPTLADSEFIYRKNLARSVGWYWHFMGVLWIVLFVLLGYWH
jgi:cytochrome c oxidase subunit III